jgi:hypothetical protein
MSHAPRRSFVVHEIELRFSSGRAEDSHGSQISLPGGSGRWAAKDEAKDTIIRLELDLLSNRTSAELLAERRRTNWASTLKECFCNARAWIVGHRYPFAMRQF